MRMSMSPRRQLMNLNTFFETSLSRHSDPLIEPQDISWPLGFEKFNSNYGKFRVSKYILIKYGNYLIRKLNIESLGFLKIFWLNMEIT